MKNKKQRCKNCKGELPKNEFWLHTKGLHNHYFCKFICLVEYDWKEKYGDDKK